MVRLLSASDETQTYIGTNSPNAKVDLKTARAAVSSCTPDRAAS